MRETLEDLYYGNITPYDRQIRSGTSLAVPISYPLNKKLQEFQIPENALDMCWSSSVPTVPQIGLQTLLAASFSFIERSCSTTAVAFSRAAFLLSWAWIALSILATSFPWSEA